MPEGPEVLDYYNFISPFFKNQVLKDINILSGRYTKQQPENYDSLKNLLPLKVKDISVKGKTIFIELDKNMSLVITHGMSGWWSDTEEKHARFEFIIEKNKLYYVDTRNFGRICITTTQEELALRKDKLGPYIFDEKMNYEKFYSRLGRKIKSKIAVALLDQNLISGIGNYLRCDILWYVKIEGEKRIGQLTEEEKFKLYDSAINICRYHANLSYKLDFTPEDYDRDFFIYMEEEDIYGNTVHTKKLNSRTFHYI